jgi:hypothetical protein
MTKLLKHQPPDEARTPLIYAAICAKCSDDGQTCLPIRRIAGAGPEITPGDVQFALPPIPA